MRIHLTKGARPPFQPGIFKNTIYFGATFHRMLKMADVEPGTGSAIGAQRRLPVGMLRLLGATGAVLRGGGGGRRVLLCRGPGKELLVDDVMVTFREALKGLCRL